MLSGDEEDGDQVQSDEGANHDEDQSLSLASSSSFSSSSSSVPSDPGNHTSEEADEDDDEEDPDDAEDFDENDENEDEGESDAEQDVEEETQSSLRSDMADEDQTSEIPNSQSYSAVNLSGPSSSLDINQSAHFNEENGGYTASIHDRRSPKPSMTLDNSATLDLNYSLSPRSYQFQISERHRLVTTPRLFVKPPLIDPLVFIPHGSPVHALALPPCGSHLFSGGQDGFIRRIAIYESVTGSSVENLTMRQGGHIPLIEKEGDKTTIFLTGYWENEDDYNISQSSIKPGLDNSSVKAPQKWGPKSVGNAVKVSPVYSLAIHSEELWGLSGTESGNINLFTIRHDEGQIRHVFRASKHPSGPLSPSSDIKGHKPGSVISCIDLNHAQNFAFTGGWDGMVLGWDLNTGQVVNKFVAHASQISTISLRHHNALPIYDSKFEENLLNPAPQADDPVHLSEQPCKLDSVEMTHGSPEKAPISPSALSSPDEPLAAEYHEDDSEDGSLFGGGDESGSDPVSPEPLIPASTADPKRNMIGGELSFPSRPIDWRGQGAHKATEGMIKLELPTPINKLPKKPILPPTRLPQVPSVLDPSLPFLNDDILMTSAIDGQVYLWDRRIQATQTKGLVRKLDVPKSTSPWTASAAWSIDGRSIYVGRRNHSVDIYDLRYVRYSQHHSSVQRTIKLPFSSGPVSCVKAWPDGQQVLCGSFDNVRLWNLKSELEGVKVPFKIIPGHSSGVISHMSITPSLRYLVTASGDRGWESQSNEFVIIHEIRALYN
ncbi:hypothetical protein O181_017746 [Austropuccinia psidii MF-1]|uniref:Transcription factor spt8 beta-propeller domain-containing protein n=1 Tax=Austropuccinia psidii MF-1 TaxID=1389203 RepID=A0A9Q3GS98_9BASI|nr:hypothetical protein [Austropuccinia psidii MF-1]